MLKHLLRESVKEIPGTFLLPETSHQGSSISVESWRERHRGETELRERERERGREDGEKVFSLLDMSAESSWLWWSQSVSRSSDMNNSGDNCWPPLQCQRTTQSGRRLSCKDERELERCELKRGGSLRVNLTTDHLSLPTTTKLTNIQVKVENCFLKRFLN